MSRFGEMLDLLGQLEADGLLTKEEQTEYYRLSDLVVNRVDLVHRGANGRRFAVVKGADTMTTHNDEGLGPVVVDDGDGGYTVADDADREGVAKAMIPGPAKTGMLKKLTEVSERLASMINEVKGADAGPPGASLDPKFAREAKSLSDLLGGFAQAYPSPKTSDSGGEEKPMKKEDPNAVDLEEGVVITHGALTEIAKAGRSMRGDRKKKFREGLSILQGVFDELEKNPNEAIAGALREVMEPVAKAMAASTEQQGKVIDDLSALVAKVLGTEADTGQPAAVAKADDDTPAAKPEPVPAGQAKPAAAPVAKAGELTWGELCGAPIEDE